MISAVFPGQGSQHVGMGHDLYHLYPYTQQLFHEAEDIIGEPLTKIMFGGDEETLRQTHYAQPALFTTSMAIMHVLREEFGIGAHNFAFLAGHSLGEYSALCAAGALSFSDTLYLIKARCRAMTKAQEGGMLAIIGLSLSQIEQFIESCQDEVCEIANINSPQQIVLSGTLSALQKVAQQAKEADALRCIFLNVSGPFHSSLMQEAQDEFCQALDKICFNVPYSPVITNVSGLPHTDPTLLKHDLARQMTHRVPWHAIQLYLQSKGVTTLVEIGSGKVLCGLAKKTIPHMRAYSLNNSESIKEWAPVYTESTSIAI